MSEQLAEPGIQPWIQTACGIKFDYANPTHAMIDIRDIAIALSRMPRFGGHTSKFYSVAQHSVLVSKIVAGMGGTRYQQSIALLHDATEAYMGDMTAPLKSLIPEFRGIEARIWNAIYEKFFDSDLIGPMPSCVKHADAVALRCEAGNLFDYDPIDNWVNRLPSGVWPPFTPLRCEEAHGEFCSQYKKLFGCDVGPMPEFPREG